MATVVLPASAAFPSRPPPSSFLGQPAPKAVVTNQDYVGHVKSVLTMRLKHTALLVGVVAWAALAVSVFDPAQLPGSLVSAILPTLLYLVLALLGALPLLIVRKQTLRVELPRPTPLYKQLSPAFYRLLVSYLISAALLLQAYSFSASAVSPDPQLGVFFLHVGRDALQLNERWLYLGLLHLSLALVATVSDTISHRSHVRFEPTSSSSIPTRLRQRAVDRISSVARTVLVVNVIFLLAYIFFHTYILRSLIFNYSSAWTRSYFYSIMRHNAAWSVTLFVRAVASSFFSFTVWEFTHICFDVYVTQPVFVSHQAPNSQQCVISGLRSVDPYYQHFAFLELSVLTLTDAGRRKAIFTDIKADGSGGSWHAISRECLKLIGGELQRAKRKGAPVLDTAAPTSSSVRSPVASNSSSSPSNVKNENIFRPTKPSLVTSLLASSAPSSTAQSSSLALPAALTSRIPPIFQTSSTSPSSAAPSSTALVATKAVEKSLVSVVPSAWQGPLVAAVLGDQVEYEVAKCVANGQEVIWAVEALSNLLCASLQEDQYGVAQRDIPKVLEAFVLYLLALESLAKQLAAAVDVPGRGSERAATTRYIEEYITPVETALRDGVKAVVQEFTPYMDAFAFPPRIAAKLQLLVDWG